MNVSKLSNSWAISYTEEFQYSVSPDSIIGCNIPKGAQVFKSPFSLLKLRSITHRQSRRCQEHISGLMNGYEIATRTHSLQTEEHKNPSSSKSKERNTKMPQHTLIPTKIQKRVKTKIHQNTPPFPIKYQKSAKGISAPSDRPIVGSDRREIAIDVIQEKRYSSLNQ